MGENKHINELDAFARKYIKEIKQESPSIDFTNSLMNRIILEDKMNVKQNKPIISRCCFFNILKLPYEAQHRCFKCSYQSNSKCNNS